jgi:hypothetical protein
MPTEASFNFRTLPFLFTFRDAIDGNGFRAVVMTEGRILARHEPEGWWFDGVNPGALAAGGTSFPEAHGKFRESFRLVLEGLAADAGTFAAFRESAARWLDACDGETEREWWDAVKVVRSLDPAILGLRVQRAETKPSILIEPAAEGGGETPALETELPALARAA